MLTAKEIWIGDGRSIPGLDVAAAPESDARSRGCLWIGAAERPCRAIGCCRVWARWLEAARETSGGNGRRRRAEDRPAAATPAGRVRGGNGAPPAWRRW